MPNFNSGSFSKKKLLLLGFIFAVLLIIPLTVFLVQQNSDSRSHADKTTTLSFDPPTASVNVGEPVDLSVVVTPGNNQVNFVKLVIIFDPNALTPGDPIFEVDPASKMTVVVDPKVTDNQISVSLNTGIDETQTISTPTKIGTFHFTSSGPSPRTEVSFNSQPASPTGGGVDIRSIGQTSADAFSESVFLSGTSAFVTVNGEGTLSVSPEPSTSVAPEDPTETPATTISPEPTAAGGTTNESPVCQSLDTGGVSTGAAPLTVTFTASGSDSDGTITKATFNFGDGPVEDQTSAGGIGTASVSVQSTHTYTSPGDFTATVLLTDNSDGVSSTTTCTVPISVSGETTPVPSGVTPLDATGPSNTIVGGGVLGGILILIGTLIFFAL